MVESPVNLTQTESLNCQPPRWGCWRRHMMPHSNQPVDCVLVPSPCILWRVIPSVCPRSTHRSLKKHLTSSLASSRTSTSRADAGPRVCPFCPDVQRNCVKTFSKHRTNEKHREGRWTGDREVVVMRLPCVSPW